MKDPIETKGSNLADRGKERVARCPECDTLLSETYLSTELSTIGGKVTGIIRFNSEDVEMKYGQHLKMWHKMTT